MDPVWWVSWIVESVCLDLDLLPCWALSDGFRESWVLSVWICYLVALCLMVFWIMDSSWICYLDGICQMVFWIMNSVLIYYPGGAHMDSV